MKNYFIFSQGKQDGPFTIDELKNLRITSETLVWSEGMEDWKKAKDVQDLQFLLNSSPPQFVKSTTPPKISFSHENSTPKKSKRNLIILLVMISVLFIGFFIWWGVTEQYRGDYERREQMNSLYPPTAPPPSSTPTPQNTAPVGNNSQQNQPAPEQAPVDPEAMLFQQEAMNYKLYLDISCNAKVNLLYNTKIEGFITNQAKIAGFKNFEIHLEFISKTGTVVGEENFTLMEFCAPGISIPYNYKITGYWKDAESIRASIVQAEPYQTQ